jgi:prepilin signal peptidase PulO-like enzyme (type II secretory pathway)
MDQPEVAGTPDSEPAPLPLHGPVAYLGEALALGLAVLVIALWPSPGGIVTAVVVAALVYCATVDVLLMRIPNVITYPSVVLVLASAAIAGWSVLGEAALGALIGGGLIGLLVLISRGKMGMGDVKLSVLGGALVGAEYALPALLAGSLSALPVTGVLLLARRIDRRQAIPYGPYLAFGFVVVTLLAGSVLTR